jgi:AsmA protein
VGSIPITRSIESSGISMKKVLKITGLIILLIIVILTISAISLTYFVNPNKFKGRISQYVYNKTGQVLVIHGNLQWSLFPWVGLKANNLTYSNPPGFTPKTFAAAREMDIKVKLNSLLKGKIEIGTITLDQLILNLIKNKWGQNNWQALTEHQETSGVNNDLPHHQNTTVLPNLTITNFQVKNGAVNWYDQRNHSQITLNNIELRSKNAKLNATFPLSLEFEVLDKKHMPYAKFAINTNLNLQPQQQQYQLKNFKIKTQIFNDSYVHGRINVNSTGNLSANLKNQTLISDLNFAIENISGNMHLQATQLINNPIFSGEITTEAFNLKNFLESLGQRIDTTNSNALTTVSLQSHVNIFNDIIELKQLQLKIDDTNISGNTFLQLKKKTLLFDLTTDQISLDNYLVSDDHNRRDEKSEDQNSTQQKKSNRMVNGTIRIADLTWNKLHLSQVITQLSSDNNIIRLAPFHANLYQGSMQGTITIDKRDQQKTYTYIKQVINQINLKNLLQEFSNSEKLSGEANISADLTSVTDKKISFLQGLNGNMHIQIKQGALQGIDFIYQLSRAHAFINRLPKSKITNAEQTQFDEFTGTGTINNGIFNSNNLSLTSHYLNVSGKGTTHLLTKEIHYYLKILARPKLSEENSQIDKDFTQYEIPIKITGSLVKPSVNLDLTEVAKIIYKNQIQKTVQQNLEKNIDHLKTKIKDSISTEILEKIR